MIRKISYDLKAKTRTDEMVPDDDSPLAILTREVAAANPGEVVVGWQAHDLKTGEATEPQADTLWNLAEPRPPRDQEEI